MVQGEIDIIEFVNQGPNNLMSLHTTEDCTIAGVDQTGSLLSNDCAVSSVISYNAASAHCLQEGGGITGCTVSAIAEHNIASVFNANGGGVYAMEWTSQAIQVWIFPRDAIPTSITAGEPDPITFGLPVANFAGSCDIDTHFYNHSLLFNIDFCGQWAGNTFASGSCPQLSPENVRV